MKNFKVNVKKLEEIKQENTYVNLISSNLGEITDLVWFNNESCAVYSDYSVPFAINNPSCILDTS